MGKDLCVRKSADESGIHLEILSSAKAPPGFNELAAHNERVGAIFHILC